MAEQRAELIIFSYLMVAGAINWNICPEVLGITKGQMFQSIASFYPAISTFAVQICYTNKFLLYSY
jgi:hypothetical protein